MRKLLMYLILLSFIPGCFQYHNHDFNQLLHNNVMIKAGRALCSGTIVKAREKDGLKELKILTAGHCALHSHIYVIKFYDKTKTIGFRAEINRKQDIALIYAVTSMKTKISVVNLSMKRPYLGDAVYVVGNPVGHDGWILHKGIIAQERVSTKIFPQAKFTRYNIIVKQGVSGSGVVNEDFELIGIINALWPNYQSAGTCFEEVKKFLYGKL